MEWINAKWEHPEKDGAYMVRLIDGKELKGWFILRKRMWVAMDRRLGRVGEVCEREEGRLRRFQGRGAIQPRR